MALMKKTSKNVQFLILYLFFTSPVVFSCGKLLVCPFAKKKKEEKGRTEPRDLYIDVPSGSNHSNSTTQENAQLRLMFLSQTFLGF
ncbi:hypothetical protein CDL12_11530 [Handroanthus impetiginosus]|uniref:Uncharacterized protein n=1 Tax=Handroanthus impetiginosus TaxID=429701 RepID=A0A2G9HE77_9LAMI|nr:hypothetical protein CDL12_11530 [Handroanthus impetiginosus]